MNPITQEFAGSRKGRIGQAELCARQVDFDGNRPAGLMTCRRPRRISIPFVTPIRNAMPRVGGGVGSATNWRQVNAIIGSGFDFDGLGAGRPALGPDVVFDLEQDRRPL